MQGLHFSSGIDKGFENDLKRMNEKYNKFSSNAYKKNKKTKESLESIGDAANEVSKSFDGVNKNVGEVGNSTAITNKSMKELKDHMITLKSLRDLIPANNIKAIEKYNNKINLLQHDIDLLNKTHNPSIQKTSKGVKKLNNEVEKSTNIFSSAKGKVVGWVAAITAAVAGLIKFGKELNEVNRQIDIVSNQFDVSADRAKELTSSLRAMSSVYGTEFNDNLKASNTIMYEFGLTGEQAIDLINKGFIKGADVNGEYLNSIKEYSPQFKAAGLSAQEMVAFLAQTENMGIFSDKAPDAIKEGTIRLREMTKSTRDALKGIDIDSDNMVQRLKTNQITYFQAIQEVSAKLGELEEQSPEVGTAIADIFQGQGEDAGIKFLKMIKDINIELDASKDIISENGYTRMLEAWSNLIDGLITRGGALEKVFGYVADAIDILSGKAIDNIYDGMAKSNDDLLKSAKELSDQFGGTLYSQLKENADIRQNEVDLLQKEIDLENEKRSRGEKWNAELIKRNNLNIEIYNIEIQRLNELAKVEAKLEKERTLARFNKKNQKNQVDTLSKQDIELQYQQNINAIKMRYGAELKANKEGQKALLENELWYIQQKKKLTTDQVEKAKLSGKAIDIRFNIEALGVTDPIKQLEDSYKRELLLLQVQYEGKQQLSQKYRIEELIAEEKFLQDKSRLLQGDEKTDVESRLNTVKLELEKEKKAYELAQRDRLKIIEDANAEILRLQEKLQGEVTNKEVAETNEAIEQQKKIIEDYSIFKNKEFAQNANQIVDTFQQVVGEGADNFTRDILNMADDLLSVLDSSASGIDRMVAAMNIAKSVMTELLDGISDLISGGGGDNTQQIANELSMQQKYNELLHERNKLQMDYSAFLGSSYKAAFKESLSIGRDNLKIANETIDALQDVGMASSGDIYTQRDRFGYTEFNETFEMNIKGAKALNNALKLMGKDLQDTARFSTLEWAEFFTLVEEGGGITTEATQQLVDTLQVTTSKYEDALNQMRSVIENVAGALGDSLSDSIVTAIENGTDALGEFDKTFNKILIDLAKAEINELFFRGLFDNLQAEMEQSMAGGDMNWQDDMLRFYDKVPGAINKADEFMRAFDMQLKDLGFEGIGSNETIDESKSGNVVNQIQKSITEETGTELVGRMNAIMVSNEIIANNSVDMLDHATRSLALLNQIKLNSDYLPQIANNTKLTYQKLGG